MPHDRLPRAEINPRLIDAKVAGSKKSVLRAYMFWYFGGVIGVHNFYLGKRLLGGLQAFCIVLSVGLLEIAKILGTQSASGQGAGAIAITALGVVCLTLVIDAFLIPARARAYSDRLRNQLEVEAGWHAA
ncbi:MAG: TM2 domain-containing protein [Dongiaceae bacterium]